jgi:hypothetical protein
VAEPIAEAQRLQLFHQALPCEAIYTGNQQLN